MASYKVRCAFASQSHHKEMMFRDITFNDMVNDHVWRMCIHLQSSESNASIEKVVRLEGVCKQSGLRRTGGSCWLLLLHNMPICPFRPSER